MRLERILSRIERRPQIDIDHVLYSNLFTTQIEKWNRIVKKGGFDLIVLDFDKTMSKSESPTPWCLFDRSDFVSQETRETMSQLYKKHCPVETSHLTTAEEKVKNAEEWYKESFKTISLELNDTNRLQGALSRVHPYGGVRHPHEGVRFPHEGVRFPRYTEDTLVLLKKNVIPFLKLAKDSNVPCVIFSAGLGDMIEHLLRQYDKNMFGVHIVSNFLTFDFKESGNLTYASYVFDDDDDKKNKTFILDNFKASGWTTPIVHCANKNVETLKTWLKENASTTKNDPHLASVLSDARSVLLVGDMLSDAHMSDGLNKNADIVKMCFHEKKFNQHKETIKNLDQFYYEEKLEHATTLMAKQRKPHEPHNNVSRPLFKIHGGGIGDKQEAQMLILGDHDYTFLDDLKQKKEQFDIIIHNCKGSTFNAVYALFCESLSYGFNDEKEEEEEENVDAFQKCSSQGTLLPDLIGVSGFARNGKSTFGDHTVKKCPNHMAACFAFADRLRWVFSVINPAIPVTQTEREMLFETIGKKDEGQDIQNYNALVELFGYETSKTIVKPFRRSLIAIGEGFRKHLNPYIWIEWLFNSDLKITSTPGFYGAEIIAYSKEDMLEMNEMANKFLKAFFTTIGHCDHFETEFEKKGSIKDIVDDYYLLNLKKKNLKECFCRFFGIWETLVRDFDRQLQFLYNFLVRKTVHGDSFFDFLEIVCKYASEKDDMQTIVDENDLKPLLMDTFLKVTSNADKKISTLLAECTVYELQKRSHPDLKIEKMTATTMAIEDIKKKIVNDARYPNERTCLFNLGALLVYVFNPNLEEEPPVTELASYDGGYYHVNLRNDGTLASYEKMIDETLCLQIVFKKHIGSRIIVDLCGSDF